MKLAISVWAMSLSLLSGPNGLAGEASFTLNESQGAEFSLVLKNPFPIRAGTACLRFDASRLQVLEIAPGRDLPPDTSTLKNSTVYGSDGVKIPGAVILTWYCDVSSNTVMEPGEYEVFTVHYQAVADGAACNGVRFIDNVKSGPINPLLKNIVTDVHGASVPVIETSCRCLDGAAPSIIVQPDSIDFGAVELGFSLERSIEITNPACADLQVTQFDVPPPFSRSPAPPYLIQPGEAEVVKVVFSPGAEVDYDQWSIITSDAGYSAVDLKGRGQVTPFTWCADVDGDQFGDCYQCLVQHLRPDGYVIQGACDCDDHDPTVHPGALEPCGGPDKDCDAIPPGACPNVLDLIAETPRIERISSTIVTDKGEVEVQLSVRFDQRGSLVNSGDCTVGGEAVSVLGKLRKSGGQWKYSIRARGVNDKKLALRISGIYPSDEARFACAGPLGKAVGNFHVNLGANAQVISRIELDAGSCDGTGRFSGTGRIISGFGNDCGQEGTLKGVRKAGKKGTTLRWTLRCGLQAITFKGSLAGDQFLGKLVVRMPPERSTREISIPDLFCK